MWEIVFIGLIGGLVTGLSPCILPVLPIVLAVSTDKNRKPFLVATGIALSFTAVTLLGTVVLEALGLPTDALRWVGVALLIVVGLSMIWPQLGDLLERPFTTIRLPGFVHQATRRKGTGFGVGLALGAVYSPCAGPVLAAVTVAGATGEIGWDNVVLALAFAAGACTPLFFFALAGNRVGARADFVRSHRQAIARASGALIIALAVAIALNVPAVLQRTLPDWTASVQEKFNSSSRTQDAVNSVRGQGSSLLDACRSADPAELQDCGEIPELAGTGEWLNTASPIDPRKPQSVNGHESVTLVDFWAYACINSQRANEHVSKLYDHYRAYGLTVLGVHAPEYAFERDINNVRAATQEQKIHYPVVQDNDFATWNAFNNRFWPAHYLVDNQGHVRQIHEGEGAYVETEQLVRQLLHDANPDLDLPEPIENAPETNTADPASKPSAAMTARSPETYLGTGRAHYFSHQRNQYQPGVQEFSFIQPQPQRFSLEGRWRLAEQSITPVDKPGVVHLNYTAAHVQLVASGRGTVTVTHPDGKREVHHVSSDGTLDLVNASYSRSEVIDIEVSEGLTIYSLTFG